MRNQPFAFQFYIDGMLLVQEADRFPFLLQFIVAVAKLRHQFQLHVNCRYCVQRKIKTRFRIHFQRFLIAPERIGYKFAIGIPVVDLAR